MEINGTGTNVSISIEEVEVRILQDLANQLLNLTTPHEAAQGEDPLAQLVGIDSHATKPTDPVLSRLYPDAYPDDPEASLEFRRFTERSLRDASVGRAERVLSALTANIDYFDDINTVVDLDLNRAMWVDLVGFLNDVRLALGTRLDITENFESHEIAEGDPRAALFDLYGWLTWMQEMLISKGYFHED